MHKHPTNLTTIYAKTTDSAGPWYSALKNWSEVRRLRKEERMRSEILSQLPPSILYDIGESDCRPRH